MELKGNEKVGDELRSWKEAMQAVRHPGYGARSAQNVATTRISFNLVNSSLWKSSLSVKGEAGSTAGLM
jgi:hypothetical protein